MEPTLPADPSSRRRGLAREGISGAARASDNGVEARKPPRCPSRYGGMLGAGIAIWG